MKKIFSFFCALTLAIGAFAIDVRHNASAMVQANEIGYVEARYMGHRGGNYTDKDWWLALYTDASMSNQIALLEIHTATDSTIAGSYVIGTPFVSFYGPNSNKEITGGMLTIKRTGVAEVQSGEYTLQLPEYSFEASNLIIDGQLVSLSGNAGVLSYDYQYFIDKKEASEYLIILKDKIDESPQSDKMVTITLNDQLWVNDQYLSNGMWAFGGTDGTYTVDIELDGTSITGAYSKIDTEYSSLKKGNVMIGIASGYGNAIDYGDGANYDFNFFITATDGTIYNIILNTTNSGSDDPYGYDENTQFSATYSNDQMKIDLSNFDTQDENGNPIHYIWLDAQNSTSGVALLFIAPQLDNETDLPEGTYEVASTGADYTMMASEGYIDNYFYQSYAAKFDKDGYITNIWYIVSGTATVTKVDGKLKIVIAGRNTKNQRVNVTIEGTGNPGENPGDNPGDNTNRFSKDATSGEFNASYALATYDNNSWGKNGSINVTAFNSTSNISLTFYSKSMTLAAGTYVVNTSEQNGTILASQGFLNNQDQPSYAKAGGQVWYIVGGTATVTLDQFNQPSITFNGINSNNVPVHIQIGQTTAIDETTIENGVQKTVDANGQIIIIRNGVRYNLQGGVVE